MYVSDNGLKDWNTSMKTLEKITEYSTAEFAIRTFILADEKKAMKQMTTWSKHKNYHVRRLASEGCRPRLPWGTALKEFKKDPAPILPILHNLVHDSEEYVRRSVANNLNDIGKDNKPDLLAFVQQYIAEKETNTQRLLKHACRSFLKAGDPDFLPFFGYENIKGSKILALKHDKKVRLEGELTFEFELLLPKAAKMRIEYAIDYMKSNGSQNRKVFMLSDSEKEKGSHKFKSKQSFKTLSTRKHYPGMHGLHIIVNGSVMASGEFEVQP